MRIRLFSSAVAAFLVQISPMANAGYVELSATGNFRLSEINENNYQRLISYTGSISYYFWELSALELSYTEGEQFARIQPEGGEYTELTTQFKMTGLDLVLTLADKQSTFQPYVKGGTAYIEKRIYRKTAITGTEPISNEPGFVPSAGVGFRIKFTNTLALKVGVDGWSSPIGREPKTLDYAGRAGISWMF